MQEQIPSWDSAGADLDLGSEPTWSSPERPPQSSETVPQDLHEPGYSEFCESIQEEGGAFYQIGGDLFVVNGWDPQKKISKSSWHHLQRTTIGDSLVTVCQCPLSRPDGACVHQQFLTDYGEELFLFDAAFTNETEAVLFSQQELQEDIYLNHFPSTSPNSRSLGGRVIVEYSGDDTGSGRWVCAKDSGTHSCSHINKCQDLLQRLDPNQEIVPRGRRVALERGAVSYLPISPPLWASLESDPQLYERSPALEAAPEPLWLTETSSCCCSDPRRLFDMSCPIVRMQCTVYGLHRAWETTIKLQACSNSSCRHRFIGPDGREHGIFNYNNRRLFSHDLLDEYTSAYTSSETPFSAWVSVVSRRYKVHSGPLSFVTAEAFQDVWFAYVKLQYLDGSMMCPRCGPSPENTIWDGVTLAFNRKHLLPTLEPPTTMQPESVERTTTRYISNQQLLVDRKIRRLVRRVITGTPLTMEALKRGIRGVQPEADDEGEDEDEDEDEDDEHTEGTGSRAERVAARARAEMLERLNAIPVALEGLNQVCLSLGRLFDTNFGEGAVALNKIAPDVYRRFFIQISAEESVIQMTTKPAQDALEAFVTAPTARNASMLVEIPAVHELLSYEKGLGNAFPDITVDVCRWILNRGRAVLNSLIKGPQPPELLDSGVQKPWEQTGCCYGLAKIRERPQYPKLKHNVSNDVGGKRGAKCSKFYSQYGERHLTGGIMCVWCTHSICYGFHCIPKGEGRNDVFSALITRWEKAPKRVIYDFACALGPYCMTREPAFFCNTQFLIDDFHSVGHTKCSPAAFLKSHCNVDPRLAYINSSAGECGNSGLGRIRKSVSYMSQARAILYSRVFLCIWNRQRIQALHKP
ncbi:hypothetical protein DFH08DRAFT_769127 [Mycena albidolilacea]|uniref:HMG domain-containing protein n=1 Tax=Mycena albidolilacea TaxID=1033008 RepID=A0AAD7AHP0_9AGAR|nr:hypothetical protein DFH08DRAFT_769127 [Mycena albidolilacea]